MANADQSEKLADLLGVGGERIQWSHVLVFFVASLAGDLIATYLAPEMWTTHSLSLALPTAVWADLLTNMVVAVACTLVAFRYQRRALAAAGLAALAYTLVKYPTDHLLDRLTRMQTTQSTSLTMWYHFAWAFLLLAGLVLALRWLRPWWFALGAGAALGGWVDTAVFMVTRWLAPRDALYPFVNNLRSALKFAVSDLIYAVLFASLIWLGLEMVHAKKGGVSKAFFLGSWGGANLLLLAFPLVVDLSHAEGAAAALFGVLEAVLVLYSAVVWCILLYKMWGAIQDGYARTTPGMAVGMLFVPFFNLYWIFQAFWGFARDFNQYVDRHEVKTRKLPAWLFLVLTITGFFVMMPPQVFPPLFFLSLPNTLAVLVLMAKICDAVNGVPLSIKGPVAGRLLFG